MGPFACVAVDSPTARPDQVHTYSVPEGLAETFPLGGLVIVPFGKRLHRGWLLSFEASSEVERIRPLVAALRSSPILQQGQVTLARWVSRRTNVPLAHAITLAVPEGVLDAALPRLQLAMRKEEDLDRWPDALPLFSALKKGPLRLDRAWLRLPISGANLLPLLHDAGAVASLPPKTSAASSSAQGECSASDRSEALSQAAKDLCGALFADISRQRGGAFLATSTRWPLGAIQQLVHHTARAERQTLILTPRPTQQAPLLAASLARAHGQFTLSCQGDASPAASPQASVFVGGTLATFLPFERLGLVIVLDEHDPDYATERAPMVHGREAALQVARFHSASVLLVSPTPDPATLWRAQRAGMRRYALDTPDPVHVEVVDVRRELRSGNDALLTGPLLDAMSGALAAREQVILFLNRRGLASVLHCRQCGRAVECRTCSTTMAVHDGGTVVRCHLCNATASRPKACPWCGAEALDLLGFGTEYLAEQLQQRFPAARIVRWDRDTTPKQRDDKRVVTAMRERAIDILVGTSLVTRREDLPAVGLVAAVSMDVGLNEPFYRASEKMYETLAALQRRVLAGGTLLLQTFHVDHWVTQSTARQDPALFYGEELRRRHELGLPPFRQLARFTIRDRSNVRAEREALRLRAILEQKAGELSVTPSDALLGPVPASTSGAHGQFTWQLHVRLANVMPILEWVPPRWEVELDPEEA